MNTKRVLLTGARAPVTLHLARMLFKQGHTVFVAESFPYHLTKHSKAVKACFTVEKPAFRSEQFVDDLCRIIKENQIDMLIPMCEETFYISCYQEKIKKYCDVFVHNFTDLQQLHHKYAFIEMVKKVNLQAPRTALIQTKEQWEEARRDRVEPIIVKPVYSRFSSSVHFVKEKMDFPAVPEKLSVEYPWVMQEWIKGTQYCSYSVVKKGKIQAFSIYQTEFTAGKGATIAFQHTHHEGIVNWVTMFVKHLNYTGQISFDFMVTKDDKVFPIECNPRATSGVHLFENKRLDEAFWTEQEDCLFPARNEKSVVGLAMWLYGKKNKKWVQQMKSSKDVLFRTWDFVPFFYQFKSYAEFYRVSRKEGLSLIEATTYDIEWNGEEI